MRAVSFARYGPAEVLAEVDLPVPEPGPGQVRIRVAAAAVNPADWRFRSGQFRRVMRLPLPFVPGSDLAGLVDVVGPGVDALAPGDPVVAMLAARVGGAYAEYALVPAGDVAPAPAEVPLGEAAAVPLCGLTALQALRRAGVRSGDRLLVHGASGGVGTFAVQIARVLGARVTAATSARNAALVADLGAEEVLDHARDDLTGSSGPYDVVFDAVNALPFRRSRRLLRDGGTAVTVNPFADKLVPDRLAWTRGGRRLRSVLVRPSGEDLRTLSGWIAAGQVRPVVERTYPLGAAAQAQRHSETGRARGKLVLVVDERLAGHRPAPAARPAEV